MYFLCIIFKLFPLGGVAISIRKQAPLGKEYMLSGTPERFFFWPRNASHRLTETKVRCNIGINDLLQVLDFGGLC